jgi:TnpA family transposase
MRDRHLHVPIGHMVPEEVTFATVGDIDMEKSESVYDELLRVAASIHTGRCTAVQALQRLAPRRADRISTTVAYS